jgi:hypothetical protein
MTIANFAPGQRVRLDTTAHKEGGWSRPRKVGATTETLEVLAVTPVPGGRTMVKFRTLVGADGTDLSRLPSTVGNRTKTFPLAASDAKVLTFSVL